MEGEVKRKERRKDGKKGHINAIDLVRIRTTLISEIECYIQWVTQTRVAEWEVTGGNKHFMQLHPL